MNLLRQKRSCIIFFFQKIIIDEKLKEKQRNFFFGKFVWNWQQNLESLQITRKILLVTQCSQYWEESHQPKVNETRFYL